MVNQSALAEEIESIIEMVPAFSPEFHALIELRAKLAPQPQPQWLDLDRDALEIQYQYQQAAM
jgi:hypothetical protein